MCDERGEIGDGGGGASKAEAADTPGQCPHVLLATERRQERVGDFFFSVHLAEQTHGEDPLDGVVGLQRAQASVDDVIGRVLVFVLREGEQREERGIVLRLVVGEPPSAVCFEGGAKELVELTRSGPALGERGIHHGDIVDRGASGVQEGKIQHDFDPGKPFSTGVRYAPPLAPVTPLSILALAVPLVAVTIAIVIETRTGEIPNWLTLGGLLAAVPLAFLTNGLERAGIAFVLACFVALPAYRRGALGGGALKLTFAIAALTCWQVVVAMLGCMGLVLGFIYARERQTVAGEQREMLKTVRSSPVLGVGLVLGLLAQRVWG